MIIMNKEKIEQKAKELGVKYQTPCHGIGDCEFEATQSAREMANWLLNNLWIAFNPSDNLPAEKVSVVYNTHDERVLKYAYGHFQFNSGRVICFWADGSIRKTIKVDDIKYWMPIPKIGGEK